MRAWWRFLVGFTIGVILLLAVPILMRFFWWWVCLWLAPPGCRP